MRSLIAMYQRIGLVPLIIIGLILGVLACLASTRHRHCIRIIGHAVCRCVKSRCAYTGICLGHGCYQSTP